MTWRLLTLSRGDGAWNMALDEAILRAVGEGASPPTVRLYLWSHPCVSLGYFQGPAGSCIDLRECRRRGVEVVRRPTGGAAILHDAEVTYSVCVSEDLVPAKDIGGSYAWICGAICRGLRLLGVDARLADGSEPAAGRPGPHARTEVCFARGSRYDVVACAGRGWRKLVGSAQRRLGGALMQHGSVLLSVDRRAHRALFPGDGADLDSFTSLGELLGRDVTPGEVAEALVEGFAALAGALAAGVPTQRELAAAADLVRTRYSDPDWSIVKRERRRRDRAGDARCLSTSSSAASAADHSRRS